MSTRPAGDGDSATGRPSTVMSSPGAARSPSLATRPARVTRPAAIHDSISRRDPRPAAASTFCRRSAFCAGGGGFGFGFGVGFRIGGAHARFSGRARLERERLGDFLERRELLERAQAEVVEELTRGRVKRRAARRLAMAYGVDPAASLQRLDDLR